MKRPHILILADGDAPPPAFLRRAARDAAVVVCADGAYRKARRAGLSPDWIIGDLDSLLPRPRLARGVRVVLDDDPDLSDLEKAVRFAAQSRFAAQKGGAEAWVLGALGGRLDQAMAAFQILERYAADLRLLLVDPGGTAEIVSGEAELSTRRGETLSLFPIGEAVVSLDGAAFPLKHEVLRPGSRGLSNKALGARARLKVGGGVWLVRERAPWE